MERFTLETVPKVWHNMSLANSTTQGTTIAPTASQPVNGTAAIFCKNHNLAKLQFWGANAANTTADNLNYDAHVFGWSANTARDLWIPSFICKVNVIMGTQVGIAAKVPDATDYFADQISLTEGDTSVRIITDTDNRIASLTVDLEGAEYVSVVVNLPVSGVEEWNCMVGCF